ncbi:MAG: FAD-binding domain-containing protein [Pseudomonadota bacterium]|nr:FAD-binding domain-containing protein [Pseudomonadota bacterium]
MIIVWFKRDLRIADHAPFLNACQDALAQGLSVMPLYVIEPELWQQPDVSFRHWACVRSALLDLEQALQPLGLPLIIRHGDVCHIFSQLKPKAIYCHEETGNNWTFQRDLNVIRWARSQSVILREFPNSGIVRRLSSRDDWQKIHAARIHCPVLKAPKHAPAIPKHLDERWTSDPLPVQLPWQIRPANATIQPAGRSAALATLDSFLMQRSAQYRRSLSTPFAAQQFNSRLSVAIAYGSLSIREIFAAIANRIEQLDPAEPSSSRIKQGLQAMSSRLYWRDHFIQKLESQPSLEFQCMHPALESLRDPHQTRHLQAWVEGKTGYPIVDACIRCLQQTGWLNFRMRAMIVSFAAYDLWLDWRQIHPFLAGYFSDYEPGIHFSQLQMQSGVTGINALRMYNPLKQSYEKDPKGEFIRQYLPELRHLDNDAIHEPWLHCDYQPPVVDHSAAISLARQQFKAIRQQSDFAELSKAVFVKHGSRKRSSSRRKTKNKTKAQSSSNDQQLSLFD